MTSDRDQWADNLAGDSGGWLAGFLAEEGEFDRRSLWRLGSWGVGSVAAVIIALLANHSELGLRKEQMASADLARQSQQIQWVAKESQNETRRLASAIDTLNSDRDRLYSRVTVLEQGLDSVTGSIARQSTAASAASPPSTPQPVADPPPASLIGPPAPAAASPSTVSQTSAPPAAPAPTTITAAIPDKVTIDKPTTEKPTTEKAAAEKPNVDKPGAIAALQPDPAVAAASPPAPATNAASAAAITAPAAPTTTPLMPAKSIMAPPDPAAAKLTAPESSTNSNAAPSLPAPQTIAAAPTVTEPDTAETQAAPAIAVQRTEFGVDLGGANSIDGLRALWRGLFKYRSNKALAELRPIIVVKERSNGLGMQLRLVAGPISDAAAAARICATLTESDRTCEPSVFDGQRLAIKGDNGGPVQPPTATSNGHPAAISTRSLRKRGSAKGAKAEEPAAKPEPAKSSLTSFLGLH